MVPSEFSSRTIAICALLVVGILCSFAFHAAVTDVQVTYTATAVEPGERPDRVASASPQVVDLDERLRDTSAEARRPVDHAAANGTFRGSVPPELHIALDDVEVRYVRYEDSYYRWNLTTNEETTDVRMRMSPAPADAVLANVSTAYDAAPPEVRAAIDSGSTSGWSVERGIYNRGETYYAVAPENETAVAANLLGGFLGYVLTPVGRGYVAVALGLLAYRSRTPGIDRVLTVRRALVVTSLAVPVAVFGTLVFESGSASRFVTGPVSALVVSSGVVAGVFAHQRRWAVLTGFTALVATLAVGGGALALGVVGGVFGAFGFLVGFATGVVPFCYGIAFGRGATATRVEATEAEA